MFMYLHSVEMRTNISQIFETTSRTPNSQVYTFWCSVKVDKLQLKSGTHRQSKINICKVITWDPLITVSLQNLKHSKQYDETYWWKACVSSINKKLLQLQKTATNLHLLQ